ncbi:MAG: transposase, partial [Methanosarcinaceae archaeon]|nr:transposase [Methanosarcinaceae archaeon]
MVRHLDEVLVDVRGQNHYLWRAVDHEGEVFGSWVTKNRDKAEVTKLVKKATTRYDNSQVFATTDRCRSYRAVNSHLRFRTRERHMPRFLHMGRLRNFDPTHSPLSSHFDFKRHINLVSVRPERP